MNTSRFRPEEVLQLMNISYESGRSEVKVPCPCKCQPPRKDGGTPKGDFFLNVKSGRGQCFRCGYTGNITTYYADTYGIETKDAFKEILKRLGRWEEKGVFQKVDISRDPIPMPDPTPVKEVSMSVIEHTLGELFDVLKLSDAHREALLKRGITEESIVKEKYGSYPCTSAARASVVRQLHERGCTLLGVPGFYQKNGEIKMAQYSNGILIPYRSANGAIRSAQLRLDKSDSCKYLMFSSSDESLYPGGTKGMVSYHLCGKPDASNTLMITEGALKARAIVDLLDGNAWVMAVPGVNMTRDIVRYIEEARAIAPIDSVFVGYDMDEAVIPAVEKACNKMIDRLKEAGIRTRRLAWDNGDVVLSYNLYPIEDDLRRTPSEAIVHALQKAGIKEQSTVEWCAKKGMKGIIRTSPKSPEDTFRCGKSLIEIFDCYEKAYQVNHPLYQIGLSGEAKGLDDYLMKKRR